MNEKQAKIELEKRYGEAEDLIRNPDKMDRFLQRLEKNLRELPKLGGPLSSIPLFVAMVKNYISKEYTTAPFGTIVAIVAALLYFVSPIDVIPDVIPVIGHLDDAAVIGICLVCVKTDLDAYVNWRRNTGREIDL